LALPAASGDWLQPPRPGGHGDPRQDDETPRPAFPEPVGEPVPERGSARPLPGHIPETTLVAQARRHTGPHGRVAPVTPFQPGGKVEGTRPFPERSIGRRRSFPWYSPPPRGVTGSLLDRKSTYRQQRCSSGPFSTPRQSRA